MIWKKYSAVSMTLQYEKDWGWISIKRNSCIIDMSFETLSLNGATIKIVHEYIYLCQKIQLGRHNFYMGADRRIRLDWAAGCLELKWMCNIHYLHLFIIRSFKFDTAEACNMGFQPNILIRSKAAEPYSPKHNESEKKNSKKKLEHVESGRNMLQNIIWASLIWAIPKPLQRAKNRY